MRCLAWLLFVPLAPGLLSAQTSQPRAPSLAARMVAIRREAGTRDPAAVARLLAILQDDPAPLLRAAAAEAAATSGDPRVFQALQAGLQREAIASVRRALVDAITATRDPRACDVVLPLLAEPGLQAHAVRALGAIADPRAFDPIRRLYDGDAGPDVRRCAPPVLLALDAQRALPVVLAHFRAGEVEHVQPLLERRPEPAVRLAMAELLDAADRDVQRAAIGVLAVIGEDADVDRLLGLWQRDEPARVAIAAALGQKRDPQVANFLADELANLHDPPRDGCQWQRGAIATALGQVGDERSVRKLCAALEREPHAGARQQMIGALARLGDARAVATIARFLDDDLPAAGGEWQVRSEAARAILRLRDGKEAPLPDAAVQRALRAWWREYEKDPRYRLAGVR